MITSSNFVGCCTGSSEGLRPFRILSTNPTPGQIFLPTTPLKIIIGEDEGGYINKYSEHWRNAAARGTEVDVLGKCQSACTLVLAHIPKSWLCFGEKSSLNLHQARVSEGGRRVAPRGCRSAASGRCRRASCGRWATGGAVPDDTHRQPAAGALELVPEFIDQEAFDF